MAGSKRQGVQERDRKQRGVGGRRFHVDYFVFVVGRRDAENSRTRRAAAKRFRLQR